jgi:GH24 family phage-related lysozyme (muramidase)
MINTEGIQLIKSFEACKLKAYLDTKIYYVLLI